MKIIAIQPGENFQIIPHPDPVTYEELQAFVGGTFCCAFTVPVADGRKIDGWCHDEGLLLELPLTLQRWDGAPIVGPVLICASDREGDSVPLTEDEANHILDRLIPGRSIRTGNRAYQLI